MKCKNIDCQNETTGKRIYCSMSCRNHYVNKYIRDYSKIGSSIKESYKNKYIASKCKSCENEIPYENRESLYCSKDCSKKFININRKGLKYNISEESLVKYKLSALLNVKKNKENFVNIYNNNPKKCNFCQCNIIYENRNLKFCSVECRKSFRQKDMDEFKKYKLYTKFNFNLSDYPDEFDFSLIEQFGWYSPSNKGNNLGGVSRDHMLSVNEGFRLGIDPNLIAHPANCKLMIHIDNISKNKTSSISIVELLQRIEAFDKKYFKYGQPN